MADQNCNVQHNQNIIDAISSAEQLLMLDDNNDDLLLEDYVDGMVKELSANVIGNNGTEFPESYHDENICNDQNRDSTDFPSNSAFGNPIRIPDWPVPPSPYTCSCCQTLRELFHVNGNHVLKLHVHGRLGVISHAVLEKYSTNEASQNHEYHMFDFCQESISNVRQFFIQYCEERRREGYTMLQDPLCYFYEALCTGLYYPNGTPNVDVSPQQQPAEDGQMNQREEEENEEEEEEEEEEEGNRERVASKSNIAAQRERAANMKLSDVAGYFHLPINVAAKELNLCSSAIKGICRREGMLRWPYRKIKALQSEISKKQQSLNSNDPNERAHALTEIQRLERRLANAYQPHGGS